MPALKQFVSAKKFPFSSLLSLDRVLNPEILHVNSFTTLPSSKIKPDPEMSDQTLAISELIAKQRWRDLRTAIKQRNPNEILQQLVDSEVDPLLIYRYFSWLERSWGVSHSLDMYCKLLHLLAKGRLFREIRKLMNGLVKNDKYSISEIFHELSSMLGDSFRANSIVVDMLVQAYVHNTEVSLAFEALKRAWDYGFRLSVLPCNPLLSALVDAGDVNGMEYVFKGMLRKKIRPDLITFNTVVNGFCKVGQLQKAGDRLEDIKAWGLSPSVATYNALISGDRKSVV